MPSTTHFPQPSPALSFSLACPWASHSCSCRHVATSSGPSRKFFFPLVNIFIVYISAVYVFIEMQNKEGQRLQKALENKLHLQFLWCALFQYFFFPFFAFFFLFIFHRAKISPTKHHLSIQFDSLSSGLWKQLVCCFDTLGPFSGSPLCSPPVSCVNNSVVSLAKHVCLISPGVRIRRGVTHFLEAQSCWHCEMKAPL